VPEGRCCATPSCTRGNNRAEQRIVKCSAEREVEEWRSRGVRGVE
jgi:hypothetical protein